MYISKSQKAARLLSLGYIFKCNLKTPKVTELYQHDQLLAHEAGCSQVCEGLHHSALLFVLENGAPAWGFVFILGSCPKPPNVCA